MLLRRTDEALKLLEEQRCRIHVDGDLYSLVPIEPMLGLYNLLGEASRKEYEVLLDDVHFYGRARGSLP